MNTIANLMGFLAALWLAIYAFNTLSDTTLGAICVAGAMVFLILTLRGALADWSDFRGAGAGGDGE